MSIQPVSVFSEGSSKTPSASICGGFKVLKPAEVAALSEQQRKEYIARRVEMQRDNGPGPLCETHCRNFAVIDEATGLVAFDLLAETGEDYPLRFIKEDFNRNYGDRNYLRYYQIGNSPQVCVRRTSDNRGLQYSFTTMAALAEEAKAKAERKSFKLPIRSTLKFETYSFKNPKDWDPKLDRLKELAKYDPTILFFKNKSQIFCAAAFFTERKVHQGGSRWFAVSTFTPHGEFNPKKNGPLMLFSRYDGEDEHIDNIYTGNVESISVEEFAHLLGTTPEYCTKEWLFPSWQ